MHSCAIKKKCGAHTHVHHLSHSFFSIFTSVVVYSRTKNENNTKKKQKGLYMQAFLCCVVFCVIEVILQLHSCANKKRKKCGAHTHVHHPFATYSLNIHVGCCLFSHVQTNKNKNTTPGFVHASLDCMCVFVCK